MSSMRSIQFRDRLNNGLLALAVMLILLTSLISVRSTNALRDSIEMVHRTRDVKDAINNFGRVLSESEAYNLLYLISGSSDHLSLYREHRRDVEQAQEQIRQLTRNDSIAQKENFERLVALIALMSERDEAAIDLKEHSMRYGTGARIVAVVSEDRRTAIADGIRSAMAQMIAEENILLQQRTQQRDAMVKQTNATVLTSNGLALVAGILGFLAIRRAQGESEKALRTELKSAQASRASEEKSVFLANMSHEIRTPMNAILGFTQLLSESVTAPVQRDWVHAIRKSGQLLLSLINNVLDLSKIEAGKLQFNPQPTDLGQLAEETIELFSTQAADKGISLTAEIDESALITIDIDAQRLGQVMMNLVGNAVKYTEQGGVVLRLWATLTVEGRHCELQLSVIDSGVGIAEEQRGRIFEPFHQADSPDGKYRQGTGLGLSITRRLVEMMNGRISVESELGKGSSFLVEIPRLKLSEGPAPIASADDGPIDFNRLPPLKILVVDDMDWNAQVAQGYLGRSHHSVYVASDGIEGVAATKSIRPNVVLMDLRMPRLNGFDARNQIRAVPDLQTTAIVAVTASSLGSDVKPLRAMFDGYIRKPYTPLDLFVTLEALFGARPAARHAPVAAADLNLLPLTITADLQQQWRSVRGETLAEVRRSMRMRDIASFAEGLRGLGSNLQWPRLIGYADLLADSVRRFDVVAVKNLLNDLARWPEELSDAK
jgi:signal transduction histidine kinase/DNA-binding NarL/FixJ family response regulator